MAHLHLFGSSSLTFNVREELQALRQTEAAKLGASRKTLVRYPDFRIDLVVLNSGKRTGRHANAGRISIQCVAGLLRIHTQHGHFDLPVGELLVLDQGIWHDVEAERDSAFLLTVARQNADIPALFDSGRWVVPPPHAAVSAYAE